MVAMTIPEYRITIQVKEPTNGGGIFDKSMVITVLRDGILMEDSVVTGNANILRVRDEVLMLVRLIEKEMRKRESSG